MAYYQARSGVCRSGVTYCGWTPPSITFKINGTDRTANILTDGFRLNTTAGGTPATLTFTLKNLTPTVGQDVQLLYATPNDYLFGGTLLQAEAVTHSGVLQWHCTAVGYQWLLDRYALVTGRYLSTSVGTVAADILSRYTDGAFRIGYAPESLGTITMDFTFSTVTQALNRIAKAVNAFWKVGPFDGTSRIIDIYQTYPEQAPTTVTDAMIRVEDFSYATDLSQVRTRVLFEGYGTTASLQTGIASIEIDVDDTTPFSTTGGTVRAGFNICTYTGKSTNSGPGALTGVSGNVYDIAQGDPVNILVETIDSGDQALLATRLGGGLSGQATNYLQDGRISLSEATDRGVTDLSVFGVSQEKAQWTYVTPQRYVRVGQTFTLNLSSKVTVSGSFLAQSVTIVPYSIFGGQFVKIAQTVSAAKYVRSVMDLLSQLPG
jgi:hypothetical protein